jgi:transcriptional regulator with XRE-family HTH domain
LILAMIRVSLPVVRFPPSITRKRRRRSGAVTTGSNGYVASAASSSSPQGALAADVGIYQELVSRIENGAANPEWDTLGKIAAALGVHPARAIGGMNEAARPDGLIV